MIRKVYIDFMRDRFSKKQFRWVAARGMQYALIHASYILRRPLCGPILGTLVTNYTCNYSCEMCDIRLKDDEFRKAGMREFGTSDMKKLIDGFASLGVPGIGFTGGEPLLRKDIFELLAHTKKTGMISHLNTNGYLLDKEAARKIIEAGTDSINISLDGANASTHDAVRGVAGAFERAVRAIENAVSERKKSGVPLRIKTVAVIGEENIGEAPEILALAKKLGADCVEFIPKQPFMVSEGKGVEYPASFIEKAEALSDYLLKFSDEKILIENSPAHIKLFGRSFRNEESPLKCYAGYNSLAVDCYGEVYPCVPWCNWRKAVGNIREESLKDFWYSEKHNIARREIKACRRCYLNCQTELNILFNPFKR